MRAVDCDCYTDMEMKVSYMNHVEVRYDMDVVGVRPGPRSERSRVTSSRAARRVKRIVVIITSENELERPDLGVWVPV